MPENCGLSGVRWSYANANSIRFTFLLIYSMIRKEIRLVGDFMFLEFILGGVDTDKTGTCFGRMEAFAQQTARRIMIVPDQYSYTAERKLAQRFGGSGLNGIEILTFGRLAYRIRQEINPPDYLLPSGKQMLIYRAILSAEDKNHVFDACRNKIGFTDIMSGLICEMKRYEITPDMLRDKADKVNGDMLKNKLTVIADIYEQYELLVGGRFSDSENDLDLTADYIEQTDFLSGAMVWFDEFSDFLPQNYRVIAAIMKKAAYTGISLCIPTDGGEYDPSDDTFDTCRNTYNKLKRTAREIGCPTADTIAETSTVNKSPELSFLMKNWGNKQYKGQTKNICLFQGRDLYSEVEFAAKEIIRLTADGMRYRDIGILCGDLDVYHHLMEAVFGDYEIPYFSDKTLPVTAHPVIVLVLSLFRILTDNWRYDDVFRYLRTGFLYSVSEEGQIFPIAQEDVDKLENYVLKHGICGARAWLSEAVWEDHPPALFDEVIGQTQTQPEESEIDMLRRQVAAPIARFKHACRGKKTVRHMAKALFSFLEEVHLPEGLTYETEQFEREGHRNEAEQFARIWSLLIEVIDQAVETMGEEPCDMALFGQYLQAGLAKCEVRIIPSSIDQVAVGTVDRSRNAPVKVMFILGANHGRLPREMKTEGVLSDSDRLILQELDLELAADTKTKNEAEQFKIYKAISNVEDRLYVTYALADSEGNALRPARLVTELMSMFPQIQQRDNALGEEEQLIPSAKAVFRRLMYHLKTDKEWGQIKEWYQKQPNWKQRVDRIQNAQLMKEELAQELTQPLYGVKTAQSVTRFETYSGCPFSYFLNYGLKAKPREEWKIRKLDIGNLCHWIVQRYCMRVSGEANSTTLVRRRWEELTEQESIQIIDELIAEAEEKTVSKILRGAGKIKSVINRIRRSVIASVNMINQSLQNGEYIIIACEKEFESNIDRDVKIRGKIDRIDLLERDGKAYIRIIDYKSGAKEFNAADIYDKLDLQLALYGMTAVELYKGHQFMPLQDSRIDTVCMGGMFYEKIHDKLEKAEDTGKKAKLTGVLFADTPEEAAWMDAEILEKSSSSFLNVSVSGKGQLSGEAHTAEDVEILHRYIRKTVKALNRDIYSGKIDIRPYKQSARTACAYCRYKEICLFEEGRNSYRVLYSGRDRKKTAWEKMRGETEGENDES